MKLIRFDPASRPKGSGAMREATLVTIIHRCPIAVLSFFLAAPAGWPHFEAPAGTPSSAIL
jgi:hypothetical protein